MVELYRTTKRECKGYNPTRFLQLVSEIGGYAAAKQLIKETTVGFMRLQEEYNRLDLSVEAYVLKPEYHDLFTDEERQICRDRLKAYNWPKA